MSFIKHFLPFLAAGCLFAPAVFADAPLSEIPWRQVLVPGADEDEPSVRAWVTEPKDGYLAYSVNLDQLVTQLETDPQDEGVASEDLWRKVFCEGFWGYRRVDGDAQFPIHAERVLAPAFIRDAVKALPAGGPSGRFVPLASGYAPYWRRLPELLGMGQLGGRVFFFPDTEDEAMASQGKVMADTIPLGQDIECGSTRYCSYITLTDKEGKEHTVTYFSHWGTVVPSGGDIWDVEQDGACTRLFPLPKPDASLPLGIALTQVTPAQGGYDLCLTLANRGPSDIGMPGQPSRLILYFVDASGQNVWIDETEYGFTDAGVLKPGESMELRLRYDITDERVIHFEPGETYKVYAELVPNVGADSPAYLRLFSAPVELTGQLVECCS